MKKTVLVGIMCWLCIILLVLGSYSYEELNQGHWALIAFSGLWIAIMILTSEL